MQTPERFRSLAATLIAARAPAPDEPAFEIVEELERASRSSAALRQAQDEQAYAQDDGEWGDDLLELAREVRLFQARVIEAVEAAVETLVGDIAADVLGRELLLAPADIDAIVDAALERFVSEEPLRVRVHPEDVPRLACGVPVVADAGLRPGDAVIELRRGSVDASLGVRLATLLQAAS